VNVGQPGYDPRFPKIDLNYTATGYLMTKGWNPKPGAEADVMAAKQLAEVPPVPETLRGPDKYPKPGKILGYFELPKK
jgi:hypothetical protein